jgi:hypothetical protein
MGIADNDPMPAPETVQDHEPAFNTFDSYKSVADPHLMIFVQNDIVPPFRFRAGGWELLQSSMELGSAMKARIAEKGFFMCRMMSRPGPN